MLLVEVAEQCPSSCVLAQGRKINEEKKMDVASVHESVLADLGFEGSRRTIPELQQRDFKVGSLLGTGSFSEVFKVSILLESFEGGGGATALLDETEADISDSNHGADDFNTTEKPSIKSLTSMSSTLTSADPKFAIKVIRRDFANDKGMTALAVKDAYYEAEILSHLPPHPNVVNLVGCHADFWKDPASGFLILERFQETLKHRLARWLRSSKSAKTTPFWNYCKRRRERLHHQRNRLESCGVDIARALKFLHMHGIVYRNLKPANVCFAYDGTVKLFDFGLARRHVPLRQLLRRLTGNTGTARYMAPEVCLHEDYSLPADIYSYGILLWEVCTLEKPYGNYSSLDQLKEKAVDSHHRPPLRKIASPQLKALLKACWDPDPRVRPTFALVLKEVETMAGITQSE
jgi:serine/threonine protein kinase